MAAISSLGQQSQEKVNNQLLRLQSDLQNESFQSNYDYSDTEDELSQPLPQQFYQELDNELKGKPRDVYVSALLKLCGTDYYKLNAYRERLSERAKTLVGCPKTRLIRRRTTPSSTKEKKCANDCYILQAFIQGERSKEILEVFSSSPQNPISRADDDVEIDSEQFVKPDTYGILNKVLSTVNEIARQQASDSFAIQQIQSEISSITIQFNRFQGSLNRIMAILPREGLSKNSDIEKLQNDVTKVETAITTMNQRLVEHVNDKAMEDTNHTFAPNVENTRKIVRTFSEVVNAPPLPTSILYYEYDKY